MIFTGTVLPTFYFKIRKHLHKSFKHCVPKKKLFNTFMSNLNKYKIVFMNLIRYFLYNATQQNGTGTYATLWDLMKVQPAGYFLVNSVEDGVKLVRDATVNAIMAGRETLFFDIQRFGKKSNQQILYINYDVLYFSGPSNFHLSEKLNTAYSAIALQLGCPFINEINQM